MTERENIISLAKEHWHRDSFNIEYFDAVSFYHAAQNEAFVAALNACIQAEQESSDAKSQLSDEEFIAKSVAAGAVYQAQKLQRVIREMVKE